MRPVGRGPVPQPPDGRPAPDGLGRSDAGLRGGGVSPARSTVRASGAPPSEVRAVARPDSPGSTAHTRAHRVKGLITQTHGYRTGRHHAPFEAFLRTPCRPEGTPLGLRQPRPFISLNPQKHPTARSQPMRSPPNLGEAMRQFARGKGRIAASPSRPHRPAGSGACPEGRRPGGRARRSRPDGPPPAPHSGTGAGTGWCRRGRAPPERVDGRSAGCNF